MEKKDLNLQRCDSYSVFKSNMLKLIRSFSSSFYDCHNPIGIKCITQIRLGLSHLRSISSNIAFIHFFLHCPFYSNERRTFLNSLVNIDHSLLDNIGFSPTQTLLFDNTAFNTKDNTKMINLIIDFVL